MVDKYNCEPECFEALESPNLPLTESNIRDKRTYEARRFDSLARKIDACRGISPVGNYIYFALNWGDPDIGYGSYVNE
jgi:hypothetical protein